jgi:hypothetical protein
MNKKFGGFLRVIFLAAFFVLTAFHASAQQCPAGYGSTDFIIADLNNSRIAVYNSSLVFKCYLDTNFAFVVGLDLLSNGNLVGVGRENPGRIKIYDSSGTILSNFTNASIAPSSIDIKASASSLLYVGTQNSTTSAAEFTTGGTYNRSFGMKSYSGVAVLPGNVLWAGGPAVPGIIDVYDLTSGNLTGTITLDNGQGNAASMRYSSTTNTVLMTDTTTGKVYERNATGVFVRQFVKIGGDNSLFGVTRGPGAIVFATNYAQGLVFSWTANGSFLGSANISATAQFAANIVYTGNAAPTAGRVAISGRVLTSAKRGIARALVYLTNEAGETKTALTNAFGYYRFEDVEVGQTYIFNVYSKRYSFQPRALTINEEMTNLNFSVEP